MEKFKEKAIDLLPYLILFVVLISWSFVMFKNNFSYEHFLGVIQIFIWPVVVLLVLLFFKKVFTYLFFSMEEFNFFGVKGRLKNITEVIEEKVEERIKEIEDNKKRNLEIERVSKELNKTKLSKEGSEKRVKEAIQLAEEVFKDYKVLIKEHGETTRELNELKEKQVMRNKSIRSALERARNVNIHNFSRSDDGGSDAAADEYISRRIDEERGK